MKEVASLVINAHKSRAGSPDSYKIVKYITGEGEAFYHIYNDKTSERLYISMNEVDLKKAIREIGLEDFVSEDVINILKNSR